MSGASGISSVRLPAEPPPESASPAEPADGGDGAQAAPPPARGHPGIDGPAPSATPAPASAAAAPPASSPAPAADEAPPPAEPTGPAADADRMETPGPVRTAGLPTGDDSFVPSSVRGTGFGDLTTGSMPFALGASAALPDDTGTPPLIRGTHVSALEAHALLSESLVEWHPPMRPPSPDELRLPLLPGAGSRPGIPGLEVGGGRLPGVGLRNPNRTGTRPGVFSSTGLSNAFVGPRLGLDQRVGPTDGTGATEGSREVARPGTRMVRGEHARTELLEHQQGLYSELALDGDPADERLRARADELLVEVLVMGSIGEQRWAAAAEALGVEEITPENRREVSEAALALTDEVRVHDPDVDQRYALLGNAAQLERDRIAALEADEGASPEALAAARANLAAIELRMADTAQLLGALPDDFIGPPAPGQMHATEMVENTRVMPNGAILIGGLGPSAALAGMAAAARSLSQAVADAPNGGRDHPASYATASGGTIGAAASARSFSATLEVARSSYNGSIRADVRRVLDNAQSGVVSYSFSAAQQRKESLSGGRSALAQGFAEYVEAESGLRAKGELAANNQRLEQAIDAQQEATLRRVLMNYQQRRDVAEAFEELVVQVRYAVDLNLTREATGRGRVGQTPVSGDSFSV